MIVKFFYRKNGEGQDIKTQGISAVKYFFVTKLFQKIDCKVKSTCSPSLVETALKY